MYYLSKAFVTSALLGLAAATTHAGELAASETLAGHVASTVAAYPPAHTVAQEAGAHAGEGMVTMHVVQVGGAEGALVFSPENVIAQAGDLVQFQFNAKNHSVVQSTFDQPCVPIQNVMANKTDAFFSGFMPNNRTFGAESTAGQKTYTIRVTDTKPIWFYCSQGQHCQAGMVGAINAPHEGERTMAAFKELAKVATENLSPGQQPGQAGEQPPADAPPAASSGIAGETGGAPLPTATGALGADETSTNEPAQQTVNAAPGLYVPRDSLFGVGLAGFVAFLAL